MTSNEPGAASLWKHGAFMRLWAAQSLSAFGNRITRTAIPVIAISTLAVSPSQAALLSALAFAPAIVAGLLGGGLVERSRKVRLMLAMDLLRFILVVAIPLAFLAGWGSFWLLAVISMAASAASSLFQNADASVLPRLVSQPQLVEANSKLQMTESLAELAGPGVAGVLIDMLTAPVAIVVDAVTFLWSALWLRGVSRRAPEADAAEDAEPSATSAPGSIRDDIAVGWQAVMHHASLRAILFATMMFHLSGGFFFGLYMLFALRELHLSASLLGIIISMGGVSALGGALMAKTVSRWLGFGPAIVATFAMGMAGNALLLPAALWPQAGAPLLFAQQLLSDGAYMAHIILAMSLRQSLLAKDRFARANGMFQAVGGVAMTVTTLASGLVAEWLGVRTGVMVGAGLALAAILPLLSPALLAMREAPAAEDRETGPHTLAASPPEA